MSLTLLIPAENPNLGNRWGDRMPNYDPIWNDMSNFVVHFTKSDGHRSDYNNMFSIYGNRVLKAANAFGFARERAPNPQSQYTVCLSEIPLHKLGRLAGRRGQFAIGFRKEFILSRSGGPIWYVEKGERLASALEALRNRALSAPHPAADPIWSLTPFIDSPGDYPGGSYRFEWEREWRHVGDLQFHETDVAFLVIPEKLHEQARRFFVDVRRDNIGPAYLCPYIDAGWDESQVQTAFTNRRNGP